MSSNIPNRSFSGLGDFYAKLYGVTAAALPMGSISKCAITHDENTQRQQNFGRAGGTLNTKSRLTKVGVTMTLQSLSKSNLARALQGSASTVAAGAVVDEVHTAYKGALVPLENLNPTSVVVKNSAGSTTYVLNTDYEVSGLGIIPLASGAITDAQSIKVSYSHPDIDVVEALTSAAPELTIYFDGVNEAEANANIGVVMHRVKFSKAKQLALISEEFVSLELEGEMLVDSAKVGDAVSKFYRWASVAA